MRRFRSPLFCERIVDAHEHRSLAAFAAVLVVGVCRLPRAAAEDRTWQFVTALQEKGYGDMAVEYLKSLQESPTCQSRSRRSGTWRCAKSLRAAAKIAYDAKEYDALIAESQTHLNKFLKENPDHPEVVAATFSWGEFAMDRALNFLRASPRRGGQGAEGEDTSPRLARRWRKRGRSSSRPWTSSGIRYESLPPPAARGARPTRSAKEAAPRTRPATSRRSTC